VAILAVGEGDSEESLYSNTMQSPVLRVNFPSQNPVIITVLLR
jgi:hypothetical protein